MTEPKQPIVDAAALVPVYRGADGELRLVLIRRGDGGVHGGQIAFPAGKRDPDDPSLLDTALREAWEEIGISRDAIVVLAELPAMETIRTGFRIFPFLARISPPEQWRLDEREIAEVIEIGIRELARPDAHGEELRQLPAWPEPQRIPFFRVGPYQLWGASYRILRPLIPRLLAGEWEL